MIVATELPLTRRPPSPASRGERWFSRSVVSDSLRPHERQPTGLLCPWDSPGNNTGVGCHSLLQGVFLTQQSNPGLLHCRQILYRLSYEASPKKCPSEPGRPADTLGCAHPGQPPSPLRVGNAALQPRKRPQGAWGPGSGGSPDRVELQLPHCWAEWPQAGGLPGLLEAMDIGPATTQQARGAPVRTRCANCKHPGGRGALFQLCTRETRAQRTA